MSDHKGSCACIHCGKCTVKCEVLSGPAVDIGQINEEFDAIDSLPEGEREEAVRNLAMENYVLYNALRQCCFCGHCTSSCEQGVKAPESMRAWRKLFKDSNLMPPEASRLVFVDEEWNLFSAYRAIYGISYAEYPTLDSIIQKTEDAGAQGDVDTLFFPGCSLATYAPGLVRKTMDFMGSCGIHAALSVECCGSPLMSAGLFERVEEFRSSLIKKMEKAGIRRLVTVCPGCADELRPFLPSMVQMIPLPEVLLERMEANDGSCIQHGKDAESLGPITFFDSCHDREDVRNALSLRKIFKLISPESEQLEMRHSKGSTLCCGAGGAVSAYDPEISARRIKRVVSEGRDTGASLMITMCPTCAYTVAQDALSDPESAMPSNHYLEIVFDERIDWQHVFDNLGGMWTGEYAQWMMQTFG